MALSDLQQNGAKKFKCRQGIRPSLPPMGLSSFIVYLEIKLVFNFFLLILQY